MCPVLEDPITYLEEAVRRYPENRRYLALLGEAYLRRGETRKAVTTIFAGLDYTSPPRQFQLLAVALLRRQRWADARRFVTVAIEANPDFECALYVRARARRAERNLPGAVEDLRAAVREDGRRPEYRLALARTLIEISTSPAASPAGADLQEASRVLEALHPAAVPSGERSYLLGLIASGLKDPGLALFHFRATSFPNAAELHIRRGLALLALARGAEATVEFNAARSDPRAAAELSRYLEKELGRRVAVSEADLFIPESGLVWPDPDDPALDLIPPLPRRETPAPSGEVEELGGDPFAYWLHFPEEHGRTRSNLEVAGLLQAGRHHLSSGEPGLAISKLEEAWIRTCEAGPSPAPELRSLRQAAAEALAVAYVQTGFDGQPPAKAEAIFNAGARFPRFLEALSRRLLFIEGRTDLFALDVYVTCLESEGATDRSLAQHLLKALAASLRLELDCALDSVEPRVSLLERLHRLRPGLVFPRLYLGHYHYLRGGFDRALEYLGGIQGPLADSPRLLMLKAMCAEKVGASDAALDLYRDSRARSPTQPEVNYRLGRLLLEEMGAASAPSGDRLTGRRAAPPGAAPGLSEAPAVAN